MTRQLAREFIYGIHLMVLTVLTVMLSLIVLTALIDLTVFKVLLFSWIWVFLEDFASGTIF